MKINMKYQLILQLPVSSIEDYDKMIELEEKIIERLGELGDVDGHDAGSGEMNIFIFTDEPQLTFDRIRVLFEREHLMSKLKVAYREFGKEDFTIIYPSDMTYFTIT